MTQYFVEEVGKSKRYLTVEVEEPIVEDIKEVEDVQKEMEKLQSELAIGDNVIAAGGIYGRVVAIKESRITLELEDGRLTVHKSAIAGKADDASAIVQA